MKGMFQYKLAFCISFVLIMSLFSPIFSREAEIFEGVDWYSGETVELGGEWDFFWDRWIMPEEFLVNPLENRLIPNSRFEPNFWSKKGFPVYGRATMRKVVAFSSPLPDVIGLSFYSIYSAFQLYINGQLVMEKGNLSSTRSEEKGDASRTVVYYTTDDKRELDIVLLMSNYSYKTYGGMGGPPLMGDRTTIERLKIEESAVDYLLAGSLGFMGIFLISLYTFRKAFRSSLFLGIFSIVLVFRQLMVSGGKSIFILIPNLNVFWWDQFQPFVIYPLLPLLSWYVYSLFPQPMHKKIVLFFTGFFSFFMMLYWIPFPTSVNNILFSLRDVVILIGLLHVFWISMYALLKKEKEALLVFSGMIFIIVLGINDVLFSLAIINTNYFLSFGVWAFLLFQSIILARRFSRAFTEVEVLSASLEDQTESLIELDRMKDEFLANTSHELKTPLNGIIGITESLAQGDLGHLDEEQSRQLGLVAMSGRRLFSLVNDILDHAQLNNHKLVLSPVPVDFWTFASPICEFFAFSAESKGVNIICNIEPALPAVLADPPRLEQVLYNLLGNALKFTEKGSILLSAWTDGREFHFSVKDSGIGIPSDKLPLVFDAFQQADGSISRRFGGTGLGLAIVKELVTLQNGTVQAFSEEGKGAEFTVSLPLANSSAVASPVPGNFVGSHIGSLASPRSPEVHKSLNFSLSETPPLILIVDDEPVNLQVLQNYLSASDNRVAVAPDGQSALDMLAEGLNPDVVLLDIMMPGISGYDVLSEIRKTHLSAELPVVLLTAKNQVDDMLKGFDLGANDFLSKPFSREELFARINSHIELKQIHDAYNRFVPFEFIRLLGKESLMDLRLGTQIQRDITVMFSDIRAFTTLSERLTPAESFSFINSYLSRFGPIIRQHGGFVDKYIGDGIMALFPTGSDYALRASQAMRIELDNYNRHRGSCGYEPIEFGIGIHSGSVMMGTVGESRRMDTTVISDVVNLAARLENLTKLLHTRVLVSKSSLGSFEEIPSRFVGRVKIKGKKDLIEVCELLFEKHKIETLPLFNQAMNYFESGSYMEAEESFSAVFAINSDDYIAGLYLRKSVIARKMPESLSDLQFIDMEQI